MTTQKNFISLHQKQDKYHKGNEMAKKFLNKIFSTNKGWKEHTINRM